MTSQKRPAEEPASPPRSNKQARLSLQPQKADLSQPPNEMKSFSALGNSLWHIFSTCLWPQKRTEEQNSLIPPVSPSSQQSTEDEDSVGVACDLHPSAPPSPQQSTEDENLAERDEVEMYLTLPERPRLESHPSTSPNNHLTVDEVFPISYHGSGGGSQSTPKRPNRPSSFITTTCSNTRPSFNIDHLAENVDNIRLDSSHSSLQSSQFTSSSFSRGSTCQSRETPSISRKTRIGPLSKPHIHERKFKASVREQNREALKLRMYEVKKHHRELVDGRLVKGAMNFPDFQLLLRGLGVDKAIHSRIIRGKPPRMSRYYLESGYHIKRTIDNAKATLNSPKPTVFTPLAEQRKLLDRIKDAAIEARLRGFPDNLPPKEEKEVDAILRKRGVVAKFAREQVSDVDVARLSPGQWLNDEIINFYGSMILARSEANKENAQVVSNGCGNGSLDVHYFSTFFWAKLCKDGYELGRLAKWTKKINIFLKDVILIPINHSNAHWTAAAINFRKKRIESYDSMGVAKRVVFTHLRAYLDAEHRDKKKKPFDFTGWEDFAPENTPEQANGWDCGVFTCHFLEAISRGEQEFAFSQSHMPYLRRRMIWEIGNATLRKADYK